MKLFWAVKVQRYFAYAFLCILMVSLANSTLPQPTTQNLFPTDGQTDVTVNPTLEIACTMADIVAAQYVVALDAGFNTVVYDSAEHINDVCSHVAFADLDKGLPHYWRARVKDAAGVWSDWSQATSFTTTTAPSIFINVFQDGFLGYTGTRDADMRGNAQNPTGPPVREWNQGQQEIIRTGRRVPRKSTDEIYRSLLKFDLMSLTDPSAVLNAYLEFTGTQHGDANENVFFHASNSLYELLRPWGEGTGLTRAPRQGEVSWTYTEFPTPWAIPGAGYASDSDPNADHMASPLVRKIVTNQIGYHTVWSSEAFVELVKLWIERPDLNHGLLIRADDESLQHPLIIASREHPDILFRPRLVVESTEPAQAPGNQPPLAGNDSANTDAGVAVSIAVLSNDSDPDHSPAPLSIMQVGSPGHGTTQIVGGTILYTPTAGFVGTENFSYTITDGVAIANATVTVTVHGSITPPGITHFTATPPTMAAGETTILSWSTTNASSISLTPSGGSGLSATGSLGVTPTQTTTYTLTATNAAGTTSASVTVTISAPSSPAPTITSFTAIPSSLTLDHIYTLAWSTTNTDSVMLTPTGGSGLLTTGSLDVTPTQTTTYTLTATGPGGTTTATVTVTVTASGSSSGRVTNGLVVYYPFTEGTGTTAADQAPSGAPLPLTLVGNVAWHGTSTGVILTGGALQTSGPATKLLTALQTTNQSTFEFWVVPAAAAQNGPARLLSMRGTTEDHANMIGQRSGDMEIWLQHTAKKSKNTPWLMTGSQVFTTALMHVVHTYDGIVERVYINGVERATQTLSGTYAGWEPATVLYVGNENTLNRPWKGTLRLLAIYDRALSPADIQQNFTAGPTGSNGAPAQNQTPLVNAGPDQTATLSTPLTLAGSIADDGLPNPPGTASVTWTQIHGPGSTTFANAAAVNTTATFSTVGTYTLRLAANDGALSASDDVIVTVTMLPPAPTIESFTARPDSITTGAGTTLTWSTSNTDSVIIAPGPGGSLPASGSLSVSPTTTTPYTLTASGPGGTVTASISVIVTTPSSGNGRVTSGLVAYYPFTEDTGTIVADQASTPTPMPLTLQGNVTWHGTTNGVVLNGGVVSTNGPATKLLTALQTTNQSTFELWVVPAAAAQNGPARLLSMRDTTEEHANMIGQRSGDVEIWLQHTAKKSKNTPWLMTGNQVFTTALMHIVHTYDGTVERVYINGVERATQTLSGTYAGWEPATVLYVGNENTLNRPWKGTLRLLAIYDRALSPADIQQNFTAGPTGSN